MKCFVSFIFFHVSSMVVLFSMFSFTVVFFHLFRHTVHSLIVKLFFCYVQCLFNVFTFLDRVFVQSLSGIQRLLYGTLTCFSNQWPVSNGRGHYIKQASK